MATALTFGYLLAFIAMGAVALAMGSLLSPRMERDTVAGFLWGLLLRYAIGLSILSGLTIWLGLIGGIRAWAIVPVVVALSAAGGWRAWRDGDLHLPPFRDAIRAMWRETPPAERTLYCVVAGWTALLSINITIGAMVPDMGQDTMWYHLSVPGQWALEGRAFASPYVMPSCYSLGREAIYAALLLVGDEIFCSLLAAQVTLAVLWGMAIGAARLAGWRAGLMVASTAMTYTAVMVALAPLGVKNDALAALLLLVAFVELMGTLRRDSQPLSTTRALAIGFLLGTAWAVKVVVVGYWLPMLALYLAAIAIAARSPTPAIRIAIPLAAMIGAAYLPWAIRGLTTSGNPVFPLLAGAFPVGEEYAPALRACQSNTSLHPLNWQGLQAAVAQAPHKLQVAMGSLDIMLGMVAVAGLGTFWRRETFWRVQGLLLLALFAPLLMMRGGSHTIRYFAICYPLAAPALAFTLLRMLGRLSGRMRVALLAALFIGGVATYVKAQTRVASFHTIQWRFHPVVTDDQISRYAAHAETGEFYLGFDRVRPTIEADARVLVTDCWSPHYLKRRCLWGDLMVGAELRKRWIRDGPEAALPFLQSHDIDYVLRTRDGGDSEWYVELEQRGVLRRIALPETPPLKTWSLYRVADKPV